MEFNEEAFRDFAMQNLLSEPVFNDALAGNLKIHMTDLESILPREILRDAFIDILVSPYD